MIRRPPRSTRTDTLLPYTTLFRSLLDRFGLALVGGWYGSALLDRTAEAEIAAMQPHLRLLQAMDTDVFVVAETSNAIHSDRSQPLSRTPRLDEAAGPQRSEERRVGKEWVSRC